MALAKENDEMFATVGCHPTRCSEFLEDPDLYFSKLLQLIQDNPDKVGLDNNYPQQIYYLTS